MDSADEFILLVLGRRLLPKFVGRERPMTVKYLFAKFTRLGDGALKSIEDKNKDLFNRLPVQYEKKKAFRVHKKSQINIKLRAVMRGYYAIQFEGLFRSISFLLRLSKDSEEHHIRVCLLHFMHKNGSLLKTQFGDDEYDNVASYILGNTAFFPPLEFYEILAEFLELRVIVYKAVSHEKAIVYTYLPRRLKSEMSLNIMVSSESSNDNEASFYPLVCQQDASIDHTKTTASRFFVSDLPPLPYQINYSVHQKIKQEAEDEPEDIPTPITVTGNRWEERLDTSLNILVLGQNDKVLAIANNFFQHNLEASHVLLRCHPTSNRFTSAEVENIFVKEWQTFRPSQNKLLPIRHGEHYVSQRTIKKSPTINPTTYDKFPYNQVFQNFKAPFSHTDALSAVLEKFVRDKDTYIARLFITNSNREFDIRDYDQKPGSLGKQQRLESYADFENQILHKNGLVFYVSGHEGSFIPLAFTSNFGSRLILNHGPSNVSIRVVPQKYAFHLVDKLHTSRDQSTVQVDGAVVSVTKCTLGCEKNIFLCEHRLALVGVESEVVDLPPNHILVTSAGTMIQGVFQGISLLAILHLYQDDYPIMVKNTSKFYQCDGTHSAQYNLEEIKNYASLVKRLNNTEGNSDETDDVSHGGTEESIPSEGRAGRDDPSDVDARGSSSSSISRSKPIGITDKATGGGSRGPNTSSKSQSDSEDENPIVAPVRGRKSTRQLIVSSSDSEEEQETAHPSSDDRKPSLNIYDPSEDDDSEHDASDNVEIYASEEELDTDEYQPSTNEESGNGSGDETEESELSSTYESASDFGSDDELEARSKSKAKNVKKTVGWVCGKVFFEEFKQGEKYGRHKCGKVIGSRAHLKRHIQRFDDPERFKCDYCTSGFPFDEELRRHVETVHFNQKAHKCGICSEACSHRWQLREHYKEFHKKKNMPKQAYRGKHVKRIAKLVAEAKKDMDKKKRKDGQNSKGRNDDDE